MIFLFVKWLHVLSSTLLFGTGLASAFYMYLTYRSKNISAIAETSRLLVMADWLFTAPTIIIQPLTGFLLVILGGYVFSDPWITVAFCLFIFAGTLWIPVVYIQIKLRNMAEAACLSNTPLPLGFHKLMNIWFWLGVPAFVALVIVFYLMVAKPSLV